MPLIPDQEHLTVTDSAFEAQRLRTWPGMAHFAGTGPQFKTCRECSFWNNNGADPGYYAQGGKHKGTIKPRECARYTQLMAGAHGPAVPHGASACKHFVVDTEPPPIVMKW